MIEGVLAAWLFETTLAAVGAAFAAIGTAFTSFFGDETTAEGCETIVEYNVSTGNVIRLERSLEITLPEAAKRAPLNNRIWRGVVS